MRQTPEQHQLLELAVDALCRLLPDAAGTECRLEELPAGDAGDAVVAVPSELGTQRLIVECKTQAYPAVVKRIRGSLAQAARGRGLHPALAAPYLSPATLRACQEAEINAWDLCGNAVLRLPGVFVQVEGKANVFTSSEPNRNVFAPKASRLLRVLLTRRERPWHVTSLAQETELSKGYVSRLVSELVMGQVVHADDAGAIHLLDPGLLLEEWARNYRPSANGAQRYFMPFEAPVPAVRRVSQLLSSVVGEWAATGPAGADLVDPYLRAGDLRLFWSGKEDLAQHLTDLKPAVRGANVLVFRPYDEFVYYGKRVVQGIPIVSDLQLYLDLSRSGGRAAEHAARFKARVLGESA